MVVVIYITKAISTKPLHGIYPGSPLVVTLGQQYNVGEKPTVILYTYINHHAQPPIILQPNHSNTLTTVIHSYEYSPTIDISTIKTYTNRGLGR